jgi:hypothetical protein
MSKVKLILLLVAAALVTNGAQFFVQYKISANKAATFVAELAELQYAIDSVGPIVECWTPTTTTKPGQEITPSDLTKQSIPESFINDSFVLDQSKLVGRLFKIALYPGTPITSDAVMEEKLVDSTRDVDITAARWPVGMGVGDFVDLRITYPFGQDYVVLSHVRIQDITDKALKVYLDELNQHRYLGALVDYYINRDKGTDLYFTKYIEPGLQDPAVIYYAVPQEIQTTMALDPNIVDQAAAAVNQNIRYMIESAIAEGKEAMEDSGRLAGGRGEFNGVITNAYTQRLSADRAAEADAESEEVLIEDEAVFTEEVAE